MLDIRSKAVSPTLTFPLLDANDEPLVNEDGTPCPATIHGPGSRRYIAAMAKKQSTLLQRAQKGKAINLTGEEALRQQAEFLADITDDLGLAYDGLQGREKFLAIYSDPELGFIAEQVQKKASDWGNFSKR